MRIAAQLAVTSACITCLAILSGCGKLTKLEQFVSSAPNSSLAVRNVAESGARSIIARNYPHSIVKGGIHSIAEFQTKPDDVARRHYGSLHAMRIVENVRPRALYVSYRIGDKPYWTRKRLQIPAGEVLLELAGSKDIHFARTRCGNLLSDVPQEPTLPPVQENPVVAILDKPEALASLLPASDWPGPSFGSLGSDALAPVASLASTPLADVMSTSSGFAGAPFASFYPAFGSGGGPGTSGSGGKGGSKGDSNGSKPVVRPDPGLNTTVTPEPASWHLLLIAAVALAIGFTWKRRAARKTPLPE